MSRAFILTFAFLTTLLGTALAAESHIIVDNQTGFILDSKNPDQKLPIASLTKIATAMVTLDWVKLNHIDLSTQVTISSRAIGINRVEPVGWQAGDQMSLRDLIYCALLASDNIAANALADYVGARLPNPQQIDPSSNFVSHMNALARSLGMKRTLFLNPTGFDNFEKGTFPYSTAKDMARLTRYAYSGAAFPFYVAQPSRQVHVMRNGFDTAIDLKNTNELLGRAGIDGVKTGRTKRAGDCLILSADRSPESRREGETVFVTPRRIIVVLLRSQNRFAEGALLMKHGWDLYDTWASRGRKTTKSQAL